MLQAAEDLSQLGFLAPFAIDRWESALVAKGDAKLVVTATPVQHPPVAALESIAMSETMGSLVQFIWSPGQTQAVLDVKPISEVLADSVYKLYISGDTLMHDALDEIPQRHPEIDCGLIHLGATTGLGLFLVTMDAEQGVRCVELIRPKEAIPIVGLSEMIVRTSSDHSLSAHERLRRRH
jgi:L-ascorbate metabolism protein UlaG (beta-lactamase superfamily)